MIIKNIINIFLIMLFILSFYLNCINKYFYKRIEMNDTVYITVDTNSYVLDKHTVAMYIDENEKNCVFEKKFPIDNKMFIQWVRDGNPVIYINAFGGKGVPIFYFNMIIPYCKSYIKLDNKRFKIPIEITIDFKKNIGGRYITFDESNSFALINKFDDYLEGEFNSELIKLGTYNNEKIKVSGNFFLKVIRDKEELLKYDVYIKSIWNEIYKLYEGD